MSRRAKPVSLLKFEGKSHRTKAELEEREAAEIHFGDKRLSPPRYIRSSVIAMAKWRECVRNYLGMEIVSSSDVGHIARYCMIFAEYRDLVERRGAISGMDNLSGAEEEDKFLDAAAGRISERAAANLFQKIEFILSTGGLIAIDKAINAKADQLTKMEDRLFLNPQAKIKTKALHDKKKPADPLDEAGFGGI